MRWATTWKRWVAGGAAILLAGCGVQAPQTFGSERGAVIAGVRAEAAKPFPEKFLWGVATAGYQLEGGDTTSNWAVWEQNGRTEHRIGVAIDHWNRYEEDFDLTKRLGLNSYRLSIEWARIEPQRGQFDAAAIQHYHDVLAALRERGIEPVVTVSHFAYPAWLDEPDDEGRAGWESPRMITELARYAGFLAKEYGTEVRWWITLNEPNTLGACGYLAGMHPPGKTDPLAYVRVMDHQVEAHKRAYEAIHAADADAQVSLNPIVLHRRQTSPTYRVQAQLYANEAGIFDQLTPVYRRGRPSVVEKRYLDYMAFNYFYAVGYLDLRKITSYAEWPIYPEGLYEVAKKLYNRYRLPLMVAENGMATMSDNPREDGWTREAFIVNHLAHLKRAIDEGVPVLGYMHWSLIDNYEWGTYAPRFGLYGIDQRDPTIRRFKTPAAGVYQAIASRNALPPELLDRYLSSKN